MTATLSTDARQYGISPGISEAFKHHAPKRWFEEAAAGVGIIVLLLMMWRRDLALRIKRPWASAPLQRFRSAKADGAWKQCRVDSPNA
jgi:hypothetical protein